MTRSAWTLAALADAAVPGLRPHLVEELVDRVGERFRVGFVEGAEGGRWVVRVPTDAVAAAQQEESFALAEMLTGRLPFAVPEITGVAPLRDGRRAVVYPLIAGRCVDFTLLPPGPGLTARIAAAIAAVHNLDRRLFEEAGVPAYEADDLRRRRQSDVDRGAATGLVPTGLLARWERMLDDVSWWRFAPTPVHGRLQDDHVLLRFADPADTASAQVVGITSWESAQIADPAQDLAALLAQCPSDAVDTVVEGYAGARYELPDAHLADRARLLAELEYLTELLTARRLGDRRHLTQATEALRRLDDLVSMGHSGNRSGTAVDRLPVDFEPGPSGADELYQAGGPTRRLGEHGAAHEKPGGDSDRDRSPERDQPEAAPESEPALAEVPEPDSEPDSGPDLEPHSERAAEPGRESVSDSEQEDDSEREDGEDTAALPVSAADRAESSRPHVTTSTRPLPIAQDEPSAHISAADRADESIGRPEPVGAGSRTAPLPVVSDEHAGDERDERHERHELPEHHARAADERHADERAEVEASVAEYDVTAEPDVMAESDAPAGRASLAESDAPAERASLAEPDAAAERASLAEPDAAAERAATPASPPDEEAVPAEPSPSLPDDGLPVEPTDIESQTTDSDERHETHRVREAYRSRQADVVLPPDSGVEIGYEDDDIVPVFDESAAERRGLTAEGAEAEPAASSESPVSPAFAEAPDTAQSPHSAEAPDTAESPEPREPVATDVHPQTAQDRPSWQDADAAAQPDHPAQPGPADQPDHVEDADQAEYAEQADPVEQADYVERVDVEYAETVPHDAGDHEPDDRHDVYDDEPPRPLTRLELAEQRAANHRRMSADQRQSDRRLQQRPRSPRRGR